MSNVRINNKKNAIVITKDFAKKASLFGTEEYRMLQEVRRDYPDYRVAVSKTKSGTKECFKGLDFSFMDNYIKRVCGEDSEQYSEFKSLRGKDDDGMIMDAKSESYHKIKEWFLASFPEVENYEKKRQAIIDKALEARKSMNVA